MSDLRWDDADETIFLRSARTSLMLTGQLLEGV